MKRGKCWNCSKKEILDEYSHCPVCRRMRNKAMARKIQFGEAIDLSEQPRTMDGDYILDHFYEGMDYCDSKSEDWIWSVGIIKATNQILASTTPKFYQANGVHCLFLR